MCVNAQDIEGNCMIWEWDELSTRNYDFAPMPVKYSILSSGQVLMNMKLSGLCVCTANQIISFEFSRGIRGRVEIEIPRRRDESNSVPLNISIFNSRNRDTPKRKRKQHIHLMPIR